MTISHATMKDLFEKLGKLPKDEVILDVRSSDEFKSGHIPGSKNIPHNEVSQHLDHLKTYKKIYIHCQAGGRAGRAAAELQKLGLTQLVCVGDSGMGDWVKAGYPIEK